MSSIIPPFVSYTVPKTEATTGCNLETGCITKHEGPRCSAFRNPGSFPGTGENPNRPVSISCTSSANSRSGIRCRLFLSPKAFNTPVSILACSMFLVATATLHILCKSTCGNLFHVKSSSALLLSAPAATAAGVTVVLPALMMFDFSRSMLATSPTC